MNRNIYIFDIETGPRDKASVLSFFDPDEIKVGNLKDPQKIADKIAAAEASAIEDAALSAITGEVVCIGIMHPDGQRTFLDATLKDEKACLEMFWDMVSLIKPYDGPSEWAGWNNTGFDFPFNIQRSFFHGVNVPTGIMHGRYFDKRFIDLMVNFTCGVYGSYQSLDKVAKFLGVGRKDPNNPCKAATAHEFFRSSDPVKRNQAYKYLDNDLVMTRRIAERMLGLERLPESVVEGWEVSHA